MKLTDREQDLIDQLGIEYYKLQKELNKIRPKEIAYKFDVTTRYVYRRWSKLNVHSGTVDPFDTISSGFIETQE